MSACSRPTAAERCRLFVQATVFLLLLICVCPAVFAHSDLLLQIEELTEQLQQQPDNVHLLLKRGDLQRRHQNWDLARADFNRVRQIQPENNTVDWFEGRLDVESGRSGAGISYLDRFLKTNPGHTIALQNRAQAYLLLFPGEIMLTSIATDLSLAQSDTEAATELITQLPASTQKLMQWQTRKALLDCQTGHQEQAALWFASAGKVTSKSHHTPHLLSEIWLARLASDPNPKNCQAVAVEILQRYQAG